jgi:hypothetical protein
MVQVSLDNQGGSRRVDRYQESPRTPSWNGGA